jgi:hypothetical protein
VITQYGATPFDGRSDRMQQRNVVDRLGKEFGRTGLHRLHSHGDVVVASDENDWHVRPSSELRLQFQTAQPW